MSTKISQFNTTSSIITSCDYIPFIRSCGGNTWDQNNYKISIINFISSSIPPSGGTFGTGSINSGSYNISGSLNITGSLNVSGSESITGSLNVSGSESITGSLNISGSETVYGILTVSGSTLISGSESLYGTGSVTGSWYVSGSETVYGTDTISGSLNVSGSESLYGDMTISGTLHISGGIDWNNQGTRYVWPVGGGGAGLFVTSSGILSTVRADAVNYAGDYSTVLGGGNNNIVSGSYSGILGGCENIIDSTYSNSFIVGSNLCATDNCTTYVNNLCVSGSIFGGGAGSGVSQICTGSGIKINPESGTGIVSICNSGVIQIQTGSGISIDPVSGTGSVTISNTGVTQISVIGGLSISPSCGIGNVTMSYSGGGGGGSGVITTGSFGGDSATERGGYNNFANQTGSTVLGGCNNLVSSCYGVIAGGKNNVVDGINSGILGGNGNCLNGHVDSFIIGSNITASADYTTYVNNLNVYGIHIISGSMDVSGSTNINNDLTVNGTTNVGGINIGGTLIVNGEQFCNLYITGSGGLHSTLRSGSGDASGNYSFVGGGNNTQASANYSTAVAGLNNVSTGNCAFAGGGVSNSSTGYSAVVVGGVNNCSDGCCSAILGGHDNWTNGFSDSFIIGSNLTATNNCTTYVNNLCVSGRINGPYNQMCYIPITSVPIYNISQGCSPHAYYIYSMTFPSIGTYIMESFLNYNTHTGATSVQMYATDGTFIPGPLTANVDPSSKIFVSYYINTCNPTTYGGANNGNPKVFWSNSNLCLTTTSAAYDISANLRGVLKLITGGTPWYLTMTVVGGSLTGSINSGYIGFQKIG